MSKPHTQLASTSVSHPGFLRLLVIEQHEAEALAIEEALQQQTKFHRVTSLATARAALREKPFQVVLVNQDVSDDERVSLLEFISRTTIMIPVVVYTENEDEVLVYEMMKAGASDCIWKTKDQQHLSRMFVVLLGAVTRNQRMQQERERVRVEEYTRMMETLRASVAKVTHDINNPLAIISGNAQLLSELGRYMDLDDEITKPIKDIEEASMRIAMSLSHLASLKDLMLHEIAQGDGGLTDIDDSAFSNAERMSFPGTASQTRA